jgi:hypothetical protein
MATVKSEDFEFSSDSPIYDFSAGFESIPMSYMPDSDSYSIYSYGSSPNGSLASSPNEGMAVDGPYGPPPQLSNTHRQARFLQRTQWPMGDPSQRGTIPPNTRPYTPLVRLLGSEFCVGSPFWSIKPPNLFCLSIFVTICILALIKSIDAMASNSDPLEYQTDPPHFRYRLLPFDGF